ncbi:hypothetical protein AVEN_182622-1 [Araneus ventricosus]|uniref:Uncharacterized protein n=1 Tax=Araneus ventricosus TaxID=182803 RepID=A0A4Y2VZH3_ARAVE|nr:hypothetical protein AVEN_181906-1 [Araneus ventricosus]GBO29686.1 hypothetical protein AVEN_182622-1 [Araneus ventricosus]
MDKVRLLPSGVQGLVPTEAALSSFTMNRSPIVLDFLWASGLLDLVYLRTRTSGIRNNSNNRIETKLPKLLIFSLNLGLCKGTHPLSHQ